MKRMILAAFLAVTIVGLSLLSMSSKCEVNKMCETTLIDLSGDRKALGERKLDLKTDVIPIHQYTEAIISKNGVKATNLVDGNLYLLTDNDEFKQLDRDLVRGGNARNTSENEKFSVALNHKAEEGLNVRYKNKETKKYKDFCINNKEFMTWLDLSNVYVKEDVAYAVLSSYEGTHIVKISLSSEKVIKKINLPGEAAVNKNYRGKNKALVRDNKMYITAKFPESDYGIATFIFDLDKETVTHRKGKGLNKAYDNTVGWMSSINKDGNYAYYVVDYKDKKTMDLVVYDVMEDKINTVTINKSDFKDFDYLNIDKCEVREDKLQLAGTLGHANKKGETFISIFDLNKKSLEYLGCIRDNLPSGTRFIEFK